MDLYAIKPTFIAPYLEAIENATAEEREAAADRFGNDPVADIVSRSEGSREAAITITGPLSPDGPSPLARFFGFGGTGYNAIVEAAQQLGDDPTIDTVRVRMNTPGGRVDGMDAARQALAVLSSKKTLVVENHGTLASAGMYLATLPGVEIVAMSSLAEQGSIGVIRAGFDTTEAETRAGIKRIKIVSSNAPNKQADPTTPQGLQVHQDAVDAAERVFIRKVAEGRGTTDQDVIDNFGKGGMLIAEDPDPDKPDALGVGMIDRVAQRSDTPATPAAGEESTVGATADLNPAATSGEQLEGATKMDLNQLKAEHPELFAKAVASGVAQERDRVSAHLKMGEASGDMTSAVAYINDGAEHSATTNAHYMAAGMNKNAAAARAAESEGDVETDGDDEAHDAALAAAVAEDLGVEING